MISENHWSSIYNTGFKDSPQHLSLGQSRHLSQGQSRNLSQGQSRNLSKGQSRLVPGTNYNTCPRDNLCRLSQEISMTLVPGAIWRLPQRQSKTNACCVWWFFRDNPWHWSQGQSMLLTYLYHKPSTCPMSLGAIHKSLVLTTIHSWHTTVIIGKEEEQTELLRIETMRWW